MAKRADFSETVLPSGSAGGSGISVPQPAIRLVILFFFFSGLSGLVYETFWVRALELTLGSTAQATSTVVATFLAGLALGALIGGKIADRQGSRLLAAYGLMEIAVGVSALICSHLLSPASSLYIWMCQVLPAYVVPFSRIALSVALLVPPTLLMGATLPTLVRFLEQRGQACATFSALYGANTLGAAAGGIVACFLGFTYIGMQSTVLCAAMVNLIIGIFSIYLQRTDAGAIPLQTPDIQAPEENLEAAASASSPASLRMLCAIALLVGFTALSYEVLWVRILRLFLTSLTYSFTIIVTMFLLGLAVGSFLIGQDGIIFLPSLKRRPFASFVLLQYVAAFVAAGSFSLLSISEDVYAGIYGSILRYASLSALGDHLIFMIVVSGFAVFIPAIFIGMLFPMLGQMALSGQRHGARNIGLIYAVNTAGCVAGSLICGLILIPTIGSFNALTLTMWLSLATGLIACYRMENVSRWLKVAFVAIPLLFALAHKTLYFMPASPPSTVVLAKGEDTTGIMQVLSVPRDQEIKLVLNGGCLAATSPISRRYMRLSASWPVLLHKHPENVLVGCFGTGTTCGDIALHPDVKHIDVVELSKMVLHVAPLFGDANHAVLANSKVRVTVGDVRNFLLTSNRCYDVVTFEPPPPTEANVVNLYTEEFYQLLKQHVHSDGIVCQWIPLHQTSAQLWKMMAATARSVFPYVSIWLPNNDEAILIASSCPIEPDFAGIQQRINSSPALAASLKEVGLNTPMAMLSTFVASGPALDKYLQESLPITDDFPRLEFFLPYSGKPASQLDVEAMGRPDLVRLVVDSRKQPGFDEKQFWSCWRSVHYLRESQATRSIAQSDRYIDAAVHQLPADRWLQYVASHRYRFYRPIDDSWVHGP